MDWTQAIAIIGSNLLIMLTFFGVTISLHLGMRTEIKAISDEMKDFHTRLALQDQEFKMRLCTIEERTK
jgi:uncharacterized iron-regulated membrane protein